MKVARLALLVGALVLAPRAARAVYQCGPDKDDCQCGMSDPYPCCDNGGNCTWWAWEAACCSWAVGLPGWGNANQWRGNALAHADYDVLDHPVVGSIANKVSGSYGHVAWVVGINGLKLTVTEQNCWGGYGSRTYTYSDWHYFDGGFIVRNGQCACTPGQTQTRDCGNCGQQQRTCGNDCAWNAWGGCTGEGPCSDGQIDTQACGDCGQHSRTCNASCEWGAWGACEGPDPIADGGGVACDTGLLGACKAGVQRCVAGTLTCEQTTQRATEVCDRLDNDCNGETDEGSVCPDGGAPGGDGGAPGPDGGAPGGDSGAPGPDGGAPGPDGGTGEQGLVGGCGCRVGDQGVAPRALLLLGLIAARRRRW